MPKSFPALILLALLFTPGFALAQPATFALSPDRTQVNVNDVVSVALILDSGEPVTSIKTSLAYDPSLLFLAAIDTTGGAFTHWWENTHVREGGAGRINLQASAATPGISGANNQVARVTFRAIGTGTAALAYDPDTIVLNSRDENVFSSQDSAGAAISIGNISGAAFARIFTRDLREGDQGPDVKALQQYLNANGFPVAQTGPGSPGQETEYFGTRTSDALIRFQETHGSQILHPHGLTRGTGYFGPSTRAFISQGL